METMLRKVDLSRYAAKSNRSVSFKVNIFFVDDPEIIKLKKAYFGIHMATDVISFPFGREIFGEGLDGEVVVSLDAASRQAQERGVSLRSELLLLCVHGLLHLKGVPDENLKGWKRMRTAEFETLMRIL